MNAVDVLAVMDTTDACLHSLNMDSDTKAMHIARFSEARAAVAELIAAADAVERLATLHDGDDRMFNRLHTALARCKGAQA